MRVSAARAVIALLLLGLTAGAAVASPGTVPDPKPSAKPTTARSGSIGQQAVDIAKRYLGIKYVYAGASPKKGFDCSGLTMYVYAQLGIQLTHYTGSQFYEGMRVPPSRLLPGDLLFFEPSSRGPQHEGMYIGNGEFIQAPHTGDVVKISSLSEPQYAFDFVGAVRPFRG